MLHLQLLSETDPAVEARTCANTSGLLIFSARRIRFMLFQAGVTEVKMQGAAPSSGSGSDSYQPKKGNEENEGPRKDWNEKRSKLSESEACSFIHSPNRPVLVKVSSPHPPNDRQQSEFSKGMGSRI